MSDRYVSFADLKRCEVQGRDYRITCKPRRGARVAIIAIHGGRIEPLTSRLAMRIAGSEHSQYRFEGIKARDNKRLHITSRNFDEPIGLALVAAHPIVVALHGCRKAGSKVFIGGLHRRLCLKLALALRGAGIQAARMNHPYPGKDPRNICNRGRTGAGVQLELTRALRMGYQADRFVAAVRGVLAAEAARTRPAHVSA